MVRVNTYSSQNLHDLLLLLLLAAIGLVAFLPMLAMKQLGYQYNVDRAGYMAAGNFFDPRRITEPHFRNGCLKYAEGEYQEAIDELQSVGATDPNFVVAKRKSGLAHVRLGDFKGAILEFTRVLVVQPDNKDILLLRASVYEKLGDHYDAAVDLKDAGVPENRPKYMILPDAATAK